MLKREQLTYVSQQQSADSLLRIPGDHSESPDTAVRVTDPSATSASAAREPRIAGDPGTADGTDVGIEPDGCDCIGRCTPSRSANR
jgi:hypothetical protein